MCHRSEILAIDMLGRLVSWDSQQRGIHWWAGLQKDNTCLLASTGMACLSLTDGAIFFGNALPVLVTCPQRRSHSRDDKS